jgi:hypothetical protein
VTVASIAVIVPASALHDLPSRCRPDALPLAAARSGTLNASANEAMTGSAFRHLDRSIMGFELNFAFAEPTVVGLIRRVGSRGKAQVATGDMSLV